MAEEKRIKKSGQVDFILLMIIVSMLGSYFPHSR